MDAQILTSVAPLPMSALTLTSSTIATITTTQQAPIPPKIAPSTLLQDLPNFGSLFGFDNRLKTLEANFSEFMQTNQFAGAVFVIPEIVQLYMDQKMNEAVKVAVQLQSDRLCNETQADNDEFLKPIDENMQKIIKEQVKEQVKTSYAVAADLFGMELKKILSRRWKALRVDTLTPKLLAGPTYELLKGSCKSRRVIQFNHFINNDLEYLRGGASSRKYTTSVTKTKAADYGHIKWIEDLVPRTMWIQEPIGYDKHALWGVSHWGRKRQQFYGFAVNWESARDVYSKRRIIAVTELKIVEWYNYKHLDWTTVRRDDDKLYKFKEGNFKRPRIQDTEDMLLLLVQGKLTNLTVEERFAFNVSLRMFTRSIIIQRHVEGL
nr:hypothetical protein [Tanacetum cinerariifolium]